MQYFSFLLIFILGSCSNAALETELSSIKNALATAEAALQKANQEIAILKQDDTGKLVHVVFFKIKPDAAAAAITEMKKLAEISEVQDLEVGTFEDLGDARALSDYHLIMEMTFDNKAAYDKYQQHPIHLALKDNVGAFLAGPPATYDFIEQ